MQSEPVSTPSFAWDAIVCFSQKTPTHMTFRMRGHIFSWCLPASCFNPITSQE
ncbi:hypothetical protein HispidOSU_002551 [Sigmodon hispidus]